MTTPLPCGCGATPIVRFCGGPSSRQWYMCCPVRGCHQSSHVSRATEESTIARWNAERTGTEKHNHHYDERKDVAAERYKCGLLLPCYRCPNLLDYADARQDRGPASGRIRI